MASVIERSGKWQAKVRRNGQQATQSFTRKTDAEAWSRKIEGEMERGEWHDLGEADKTTLAAALDRYQLSKTVNKKSHKRESARIKALKNQPLAKKHLSKIRSADIAKFRDDERARGMAENSIRLDLALLSHAFKTAATEWQMSGLSNPVRQIERPRVGAGRERRLLNGEEARLLDAIKKAMPRTVGAQALVVLAIETGMRQSEILGLSRSDIVGRITYLRDTKNGTPRAVPLSRRAIEAINGLPDRPDGKLFDVTQDRLVRAFSRACKDSGIENLRYHDLRHEAASRLAALYQAHELAKIFGWKTIQMAMRYYHPDVNDFVARLDVAEDLARKPG
ncbi:MAG: site-specific integrase [Azonexus sp.]|nr:site-specific integrase [Azonexus sp.]MDZ4313590.1 site-specific integrase [Azonexus sp.]